MIHEFWHMLFQTMLAKTHWSCQIDWGKGFHFWLASSRQLPPLPTFHSAKIEIGRLQRSHLFRKTDPWGLLWQTYPCAWPDLPCRLKTNNHPKILNSYKMASVFIHLKYFQKLTLIYIKTSCTTHKKLGIFGNLGGSHPFHVRRHFPCLSLRKGCIIWWKITILE